MEKLGLTATDTITGFTGVVTGYCAYITGCNQMLLQPRGKDKGNFVEAKWFDEQRLEFVKGKRVVLDNSKSPGFDKPAPIK